LSNATAQNTHRSEQETRTGYPARILLSPEIEAPGLRHLDQGEPALLRWNTVRLAIAAEIGEPEGVRTIVFDLISGVAGGGWLAHRLDAEPGAEAMLCARALTERLEPEACGPSIKSLATDGIASRWYPDLPSFEEDAIELLARVGD
jgi:hypothetical protein